MKVVFRRNIYMYKTRHIVTLFCIYSISANNSSFCLRLEKRERKKKGKEKQRKLIRKAS